MCGIAGILNRSADEPVTEPALRGMLAMLRHRGPDQFGIFLDKEIGLGSARLSIIDPGHGQQPISNEDGSLWIVFNGEIFNYLELRPGLEARGHRFKTRTDTEVLLHLFEEFGPDCLARLNGQFAFAIWNTRERSLFLGRDRLGVRPLFYTTAGGALVFGSEMKAIFASGRMKAALEPKVLDQVFTYWSTVSPETVFKDVVELPPGHWLKADADRIEVRRYWQMPFADRAAAAANPPERVIAERTEELRALLTDAVKLRLRADVPVAAYLSGGLDSAVVSALARETVAERLHTFSIAFENAEFDESVFQRRMAAHLGTRHEIVRATDADIGRIFPEVIWHCETPILRTSPAPMYLLSELVQRRGFKVTLTGEGADELLAGYDIFKEMKIRRFWGAQSHSHRRPQLLGRLYPEIPGFGEASQFLKAFFGEGLTELASPFYSHAIRWHNGLRHRRFYSADLRAHLPGGRNASRSYADELPLPAAFEGWGPLDRAQYLEATLFLGNYLLSSQGDRMAMAHSVEGRFPFLDHRVVEFCGQLPARLKLRVLQEKYLLRRMAAALLPTEIAARRKRPYRAPIHRAFFPEGGHDYVNEILSPEALRAAGLFDQAAVGQLTAKLKRGARAGETDDMALAGILSTQLVYRQFVERFQALPPLSERDNVKLVRFSQPDRSQRRFGRSHRIPDGTQHLPDLNGHSKRESEIISTNAL